MNCCSSHEHHKEHHENDGTLPAEHAAHGEHAADAASSVITKNKPNVILVGSVMISASMLILAWAIVSSRSDQAGSVGSPSIASANPSPAPSAASDALAEEVVPSAGVFIPVRWGDLGKRLVESGAIDRDAFAALYAERGGLSADVKNLLDRADNDRLVITPQNSGEILNVLWALGLANKNRVLDEGPMQDPKYGAGDVGRFASTGGWTLAKGNAMDHYSKHAFIPLTADQQALVERVAQGVYRPCCGNSVYFPDCNHGMAMLGLLELMASQGVSEENMYRAALAVNSYWFPDTYLTIAKYYGSKGIPWKSVNPKEILGANLSSASGYRQIAAEVEALPGGTPKRSSGGCGV